jgi:hypothetical protein
MRYEIFRTSRHGRRPDDPTATRELERLRRTGVRFLLVAWPAFWWLNHYLELHRHLRSTSRCTLENDRFVVFDLWAAPERETALASMRQ